MNTVSRTTAATRPANDGLERMLQKARLSDISPNI